MASNLIVETPDPATEPGNLDQLEAELSAAVTSRQEPNSTPQDPPSTSQVHNTPEVPEKYKGKSVEEIIEMHKNLESAYGRMANDLGQQRSLTDRLLDLKRTEDLQSNSPQPLPEVTTDDILDKPGDIINQVVEVKLAEKENQLNSRLSQIETSMAQQACMSHHPDLDQVTQAPEFAEWLSRSPLRQQAANQAANGDWAEADALLTDYKDYMQHTKLSQSSSNNSQASGDIEAARNASLEGGKVSENNKSSGKIYRRTDLMELRLRKPDTYYDPVFQEEIMQAYREHRVK